jgi:hypothetical protein
MSDNNPAPDPKQSISLDPENTSQGAMERLFLAETYGPADPKYVAGTDLEQMWDMRQVIETRLKNPAEYDARGAKNEIDIVKMGSQFEGFSSYPKIDPSKEKDILDTMTAVNKPHDRQQAAYAQHVQDAVTVATETMAHSLAGYPNATAWVTQGTPSPGPGFYVLGSEGNNTFYGTLSQLDHDAKSGHKTDGLEGKTPVEMLRHYAAQARADAAQKSASKHKKLRLLVKKRHNIMPSFAPHSGRPTGQPTSAAHSDTGFRSDPALARSSLQRKMDDLLRSRMTGVTAEGFAGTGGAAAEIWDAAELLPPGSHGQTEYGRMTRMIRASASMGLRVKPRSGAAYVVSWFGRCHAAAARDAGRGCANAARAGERAGNREPYAPSGKHCLRHEPGAARARPCRNGKLCAGDGFRAIKGNAGAANAAGHGGLFLPAVAPATIRRHRLGP